MTRSEDCVLSSIRVPFEVSAVVPGCESRWLSDSRSRSRGSPAVNASSARQGPPASASELTTTDQTAPKRAVDPTRPPALNLPVGDGGGAGRESRTVHQERSATRALRTRNDRPVPMRRTIIVTFPETVWQ